MKSAIVKLFLREEDDEEIKTEGQPEHFPPEGVEKVEDTEDTVKRRVESKYVLLPGMESIPLESPCIRCGYCSWYRVDGAKCIHPKNDYQCNGMLGCCEYWQNPNAEMWLKGSEPKMPEMDPELSQ